MDKVRIVIAEDNPGIAFMLKSILEQDGRFEVLYAVDGEQALALCQYYLPHVAILDLMMPKLHGLTVCKALKGAANTRQIKVIMLTGIGGAHSVNEATQAGVDVYMTKPFLPQELLGTLEGLFSQGAVPDVAVATGIPMTGGINQVGVFGRGVRVSVLPDEGSISRFGTIKSRILSPVGRPANEWGYRVAFDDGDETDVRWNMVSAA